MKLNIAAIGIGILFLFSTSSCIVVRPPHHDNGFHKGWYKSTRNPHFHDKHKHHTKVYVIETNKRHRR